MNFKYSKYGFNSENDFKKAIRQFHDRGLYQHQIAEQVGCSRLTIIKAFRHFNIKSIRKNLLFRKCKFKSDKEMAQEFAKFLQPRVPPTRLATTHDNHVAAPRGTRELRESEDKTTYEVAPSGNAVVIEEQLMKVTETQTDYRLVTNLYEKHLSMIKAAIGRDRS